MRDDGGAASGLGNRFTKRCPDRQRGCQGAAESKGRVRERRMEVGLIFKIAAVGILVTILSQVLKHSGREEHAFLLSLAALLLVLGWIVPYIYDLFSSIQTLFSL